MANEKTKKEIKSIKHKNTRFGPTRLEVGKGFDAMMSLSDSKPVPASIKSSVSKAIKGK